MLLAHQTGIANVVATMGTALTPRHIQLLRRYVPRVVLVFDGDAGGATGVDRALELFVGHEVELAVATLPDGLDPCDMLLRHGPEAFQQAIDAATDVLDFTLTQVWDAEASRGVEGRRRALDAVLNIIALAPASPGQAGAVKQQLMVNRLAQRFALKEETVWARLKELKQARRSKELPSGGTVKPGDTEPVPQAAPAPKLEQELLQVLLAFPELVPLAAGVIRPEELEHPGLRRLLMELYALQAAGDPWTVDDVRARIGERRLAEYVLRQHDLGRVSTDPRGWLARIIDLFQQRRVSPVKQELHNQLHAVSDHDAAVALLRRLQDQTVSETPGAPLP